MSIFEEVVEVQAASVSYNETGAVVGGGFAEMDPSRLKVTCYLCDATS